MENKMKPINDAIDDLDLDEIEKQLDILSKDDPLLYEIEDSTLFAKRIIKKSGGKKMINKRKLLIVAIASALTLGTTIHAMSTFKNIILHEDDRTIRIFTSKSLDDPLTQKLLDSAEENFGKPYERDPSNETYNGTLYFDSLEEACTALDLPVPLPSDLPEGYILDNEIQAVKVFEDQKIIYVLYRDADENIMLSITVDEIGKHVTSVGISNDIHAGTHTTPLGFTYDLYDISGTIHAKIFIDNIEYSINPCATSEEEFYKIIDSIDLSIYQDITQ